MNLRGRISAFLSGAGLVAVALAAPLANAELVTWQFEVEVTGLADPATTVAYFPKPLSVENRERFTIQLVVDTSTPFSFSGTTEASYPFSIKSARAFGAGWNLDLPVLSVGGISLRNNDSPGRDQIFAVATGPVVPGETWFSLQPIFDNIAPPGGAAESEPLTSVAFPNPPAPLSSWNNSYFYFSARRDQPGQQVDGAAYGGRLVSFSVIRDFDADGIVDDDDNCPGTANANQQDSNRDGYGDACVHPTVLVPANAAVNPFVLVGAFTEISAGVTTGSGVRIGRYVELYQNVALGQHVQIGNFVEVSRSVRIGDASTVGAESEIAGSAQIAGRVIVGRRVRVGQGAVLCPGANVGNLARIGRNALVQTNAVIRDGAVVPGRATTPALEMCLPDGAN